MRNFGRRSYGIWQHIPILADWLGQGGSADHGLISGNCTDIEGLLGPPGKSVLCADLRSAQEGKYGTDRAYQSYTPPADDDLSSQAADYLDETFGITEKPPPKIPAVAYGLVFGILGLGAYTFYTAYQNRRS